MYFTLRLCTTSCDFALQALTVYYTPRAGTNYSDLDLRRAPLCFGLPGTPARAGTNSADPDLRRARRCFRASHASMPELARIPRIPICDARHCFRASQALLPELRQKPDQRLNLYKWGARAAKSEVLYKLRLCTTVLQAVTL